MEKFISFLVTNYVWFLVGAIILVFALIGYLVDTNTKKKIANGEIIPKAKKEKIKQPKTKEDLTKESISEMENVPIGDAMKPKNKKTEEVKTEQSKEESKKDTEVAYDEPIIKAEEPSEDSFEVDEK